VLVLSMERPYSITAVFDPQLVISASGPLGSAEVGNPYSASLTATGGAGTYAWSPASGTLPPGLSLKVSGQISGTPAATGKFVFTVRVTSGPQQVLWRDSITVTAPTLALGQVLGQLLTGTGALSPSDLAYLDFIGNRNNGFDVGDFFAWAQLTGATPSAPAARQAIAAARRRARP
jgi:putative Ig domain-containing protein